MTEKSPWADAIGPLLTLQAFAEETGLSQESIEHFISRKYLCAVMSSEGDVLLPVGQLGPDILPMKSLPKILPILYACMDSYMVATWMNTPRIELLNLSPWDYLLRYGRDKVIRGLVEDVYNRFTP